MNQCFSTPPNNEGECFQGNLAFPWDILYVFFSVYFGDLTILFITGLPRAELFKLESSGDREVTLYIAI